MEKIKAIIFDLDDTLFDTFNQLVQPATLEACEAMIKVGLNCTLEECLSARAEIVSQQSRISPFEILANKYGIRQGATGTLKDLAPAGRLAFHRRRIKENIRLFPNTEKTLRRIKSHHEIFLVTLGHPDTQKSKVETLGLDQIFENPIYVDIEKNETKKTAFQKILDENSWAAAEIVSLGNRIDTDVGYARELGMKGVLFAHGEYLHLQPRTPLEIPDFTVKKIEEFEEWLKKQG